jgi:GTP pyrophosphokinase
MVADNGEVGGRNDFPARVRGAFGRGNAAMVLKAYEAYACAVARSKEDAADVTRAADILLDQGADSSVVTGALLAPPYQRGDLTTDEVKARFGEEIATLIKRASSERALRSDREMHRIEDLRRWVSSMSDDIRTVILRLGLRLAALEELAEEDLENGQSDRWKDVARETLQLYVPLADRMGMGALSTRLEDLSFSILQPAVHAELSKRLERIREEDQICLALLKDGIRQLLTNRGLEATIEGRTKGLYSIYQKMRRLDSSLEEIMDRIGLRIIVPSVEECYAVLGMLHTRFRPIPGTFDDYIGLPKENGYQSLHTCVYPVPDASIKPVEFQIRTEAMHHQAEYGIAAHWLYKSQREAEAESQRQLEWLRNLLPPQEKALSIDEFLEHLHRRSMRTVRWAFPLNNEGRPAYAGRPSANTYRPQFYPVFQGCLATNRPCLTSGGPHHGISTDILPRSLDFVDDLNADRHGEGPRGDRGRSTLYHHLTPTPEAQRYGASAARLHHRHGGTQREAQSFSHLLSPRGGFL